MRSQKSRMSLLALLFMSLVSFAQVMDLKSAKEVLSLGDEIVNGRAVDETAWQRLFQSNGYRQYLVYSDSIHKKKIIKNTLSIAFDSNRREELDSMLKLPIKMDANMLELMMVKNFDDLRRNRSQALRFLEETDFAALLMKAEALTRSYLPDRHKELDVKLHQVFLVCSDPDGKVTDSAIVLDLNTAMGMGKEDLVKFIAHEYHHNFRAIFAPKYKHPLMVQLNKVHQEGLADLIDKPEPPLKEFGLYPSSLLDFYNTDFYNTPQVLKQLDALCSSYVRGTLNAKEFRTKLRNYFKFGGHTTGYYMSLLIASTSNRQALIDSYDDTIAFVELYNKAAKGKAGQHVFSQEFMTLINDLKAL